MTLNIIFQNDERKEIRYVYSISTCYGRIYIHTKTTSRAGENIETCNYPLNEIVDIVVDI